jgi:cell division protein FtsW
MISLNRFTRTVSKCRVGWHEPDWRLIIIAGSIIIFGLIMLSSASAVVAYNQFQDSYHYFKHQLFGLAVGLAAFWFFSVFDYHRLRKYALPLLVVAIFSLSLVFVPGIGGDWGTARSWIKVFGFSIQPSEFVKLFFLLYLAAWLEGRGKKMNVGAEGIAAFVSVLVVIALMLIAQPDVGTLSIIIFTSLVVYYVGGGKIRHILAMILIGILGLIVLVAWKPYQLERFKCMVNPNYSIGDKCYQINQSLIAVGSGGWFGRGLGESMQKFFYLPQVQGDAIFSIIGEETGLFFSSALVILFLYIFYRGYVISRKAPDPFGMILAIGIVTWINFQAMVNIGGMVNIMPMTGVPLPLVSYGGSALLVTLSALGIIINISRQTKS